MAHKRESSPARLVWLAAASFGLVSGLMIHAVSRADADVAGAGSEYVDGLLVDLTDDAGVFELAADVELTGASTVEGESAAQDRRPARAHRVQRVCRVTAYCDRGLTAAGVPSGVGQCAAPESIPLGSKVYIPALKRSFLVTDRTHKRLRRSTVDIFLPSAETCRKFGRKFLECEFTLPKGTKQG